jgi:hypothetical protein
MLVLFGFRVYSRSFSLHFVQSAVGFNGISSIDGFRVFMIISLLDDGCPILVTIFRTSITSIEAAIPTVGATIALQPGSGIGFGVMHAKHVVTPFWITVTCP